MSSNKNEVFEYLIDQLRQQVNNNQCEDLAHEVQSLKNQLRDASELVAELQETIKLMNEDFNRATNRGGPLPKGVSYVVGEHGPEQSGCRDDAARVEKSWVENDGAAACPVPDDTVVDIKFRNGEVESNTKALWWSWGTSGGPYEIVEYRVVKQGHGPEQSGCRKEDVQGCEHEWCAKTLYGTRISPTYCRKCGLKK